jgi:cell division protein FtsL
MATRKYYTEGSGARQLEHSSGRRAAAQSSRSHSNTHARGRNSEQVRRPETRRAGYVSGNAIPKTTSRPKSLEIPLSVEERRAWVKKQSEIKARQRAQMHYTVGMVCAVVIAMTMCCYLLWNTASVRADKNDVVSLQAKLENQLEENANYSSGLESMVDFDDIYEFATSELGMVYSQPGQTLYYSQNNDDYVVQFKDVPEAN